MTKLWNSIKRNPVINAFILTAIGQIVNDYLNNEIGWDNLGVYLGTVAIGVIARMFTVPEFEHRDLEIKHDVLSANYSGALKVLKGKGEND